MSRRYTLDTLPDCAAKRAIEAETRATLADEYAGGCEKNFQADAERWLTAHGFWARLPKYLDGSTPPAGWYVHLHQPQGNHTLLDLLMLGNDGKWLEIELKTAKGKLRKGQSAIIAGSNERAVLARSMAELIDAVMATWPQLLEG